MHAVPSFFEKLNKIDVDLYRCDRCHKTMRKNDSMVLYDHARRKQFRMCRKCQLVYYLNELKELNPSVDIKMKIAEFSKNIKDGIDNRK